MNERPQILTLNLTDKSNSILVEKGFNLYQGSLGKLVDTKNEKHKFKYHLLNNDFPANAHEYDIVIVDFSNEETIDYVKSDNQREKNKTENNSYLICKYPQTIFDPRGLSSHAFIREIREILKKECLIIVFQNENVDIEYKIVEENGDRPISKGSQEANFYEFIPNFYFQQNKFGKETKVIPNNGELTTFLEKFNKDFNYENTFFHPTIWENEEKVPDPKFYPIIQNLNNEIISYIYLTDKVGVFIFPVLEDNSLFLLGFLETIAPSLQPNLFPYSTQNKWTENIEYALPNQERLIEEKKKIEQDFKKSIETKNKEIISNNDKYSFLHKILTETGDELVSAVIQFLEWLGFENIIDMDTQTEGIKEEDIQIETDKGLLVIEVKGIGGTSKDSECSQISKIKYRRAKEREKFDVYGLYIVNHQRHIPAKKRENPPFTKEQKQDSINEERGLLTTWTLFNLYFDIQKDIITKEEARQIIYNYGLITFIPQNIKLIDTIKEIFLKGEVFILNIDGIKLKTGDTLYIEKNKKFQKLTIIEIKLDDKIVTEISNGEAGIKGTIKVSKNSKVWIKNLP
ncbi:hypothetical protein [Gillisia limnaea]|uniref:Uncharacterized protein n=1 Tax=Gillisia limnaea (strain DSM 15749 / LMG 21470 / R-8282) TaxID=865937 RepID=H2BXF7_GILLR|nr:hypothetical protein [Gillisia limnaea]EHQ02039.1 hypothetical protein Gilli_1379 [Gillisia limnaea DSM 15749]